MKKILLFLFCFAPLSIFGQTLWFKTTAYAQASIVNEYYYWGDWQDSNISMCINLDIDRITIYSPRTQIYQICDTYGETFTDSFGGSSIMFCVIDQDYDQGYVRLRIDKSGTSQIYIDFANVAWVYNVIRTQ